MLQQWKLGGAGGWDYLIADSAKKRLFLSRATRVDVVSMESGKLIGSIPDTQGVHGIALAPTLNRGFTSNGRANTVTVFDLDTLKVIQEAKVSGRNPDAILYEPAGQARVHLQRRIEGRDGARCVEPRRSSPPSPCRTSPNSRRRMAGGRSSSISKATPDKWWSSTRQKLAVKSTWPLPGCNSPSGIAIDSAHRRLFSVCDGKVMAVTDAVSGKQVALVPIGEHPDAAGYDKKRGIGFIAPTAREPCRSFMRTHRDRYTVVQTLATQRGARTMALDEATGKVYLVTADFGPAPPATAEQPHPRPALIPDSFVVLVVGGALSTQVAIARLSAWHGAAPSA